MKILISGASGLVGSALTQALEGEHEVYQLVRRQPSGSKEIYWNVADKALDSNALEGFDAVVHLAGESIASGRWSDEKKKAIRDSRVNGTHMLCQALAKCKTPPQVFVGASAIGYYGNGSEYTEDSAHGDDFLAKVCMEWEAETKVLETVNTRVVNARFGIILSPKGGALKMMLPPFLMGGGGILGNGEQVMSWVSIDDVVGAIRFAIEQDKLSGPVNVTAPLPVTNYTFTKALGKAIHRPTLAPVPGFMVRLLFGEMGDTLLLSSAKVLPKRLKDAGYSFKHADINEALTALL